jgi:hypothetical protein
MTATTRAFPDLVEVLGQVREEGRVRRIAGFAAGVLRGVLVVRGVTVVRVAARCGLVVLANRDGVLVVLFGGGVVAWPGLRRLRVGRVAGAGLGVVAVLWRGVAGLGSAVPSGTAGRLVFGGTVRAAGVLTGLAGLSGLRACCRAGGGRRGLGEGPGVRDAGLGALDAGGGAVRFSASRLLRRMLRCGPVATIGVWQGTGQNRQIGRDR